MPPAASSATSVLCLLPGLAAAALPSGEAGDHWVLAAGAASSLVLLVHLRRWRQGRPVPSAAWLIALAAVLRLMVWVGPVRFDDDLWRYLWDGIVTASGVSPYRFSPQAVREHDPELDPLLLGEEPAEELATLAARAADPAVRELLSTINFAHLPTIYPPTSQLAFAVAAVAAPGSDRLWRAATAGADLLVVVLLLRLLAALGRPAWWAAAYALHPLPALEFAAGGHQDPLGIALVLAAVLALLRLRRAAAGALLAAAAGVKLFPAVLALAWGRRLGFRGAAALAGAGLALALPFAWLGPPDLGGLAAYVRHWEFFSGPYAVLAALAGVLRLDAVLPGEGLGGRLLLLGLLVLMAVGSRFWRWQERRTTERGLRWLEAVLVLSPVVDPWYVPWGLAAGALRGSSAWPLLAALVPLAYFGYTPEGHPWALRLVVWLPFLWLWIGELRRDD